MKPEGKGKLSKRDGDKMGFPVFPLEWKTEGGEVFSGYREDGYLPAAVVNMLALLGWNPGTEQEVFGLSELTQLFDLSRVNKSGAKFDPEKTKWFQHQYLQQESDATLAQQFSDILKEKSVVVPSNLVAIVGVLKERATFVSDIWEQGSFFFEAPKSYDEKAAVKAFKDETPQLLGRVLELIEDQDPFTSVLLSEKIKEWITLEAIGFGKVMMPLRLALVGEMKGPDVFEIMALLRKDESVSRIEKAISFIAQK
jgi:glutamyl-tRNA synthetase